MTEEELEMQLGFLVLHLGWVSCGLILKCSLLSGLIYLIEKLNFV